MAVALSLAGLAATSGLVKAPLEAEVLPYGLALAAAGLALPLTWRQGQAGTQGGVPLLALAGAVLLFALEASPSPFEAASDGHSPALAGMTGGSLHLAGVAWPLAVLAIWLLNGRRALRLDTALVPGLSCLCIGAIYAFTIYMRGSISALDVPVFLILFGIYLWRSSRTRGAWGQAQATKAGAVASLVLAAHVALWTLLLALVSATALADGVGQVGLDAGQRSEFLLALSQALFTVVLLSSLRISWKGGLAMAALYSAEAALTALAPGAGATFWHNLFAVLYLGLSVCLVVQDRARLYTLAGMAPPQVARSGRPAP